MAIERPLLALEDKKFAVRRDAIVALGKIGPVADAAVPALTELSNDDSLGVRAKEALRKITGD